MNKPNGFYRMMLLFQIYSGAIASLVCPPLLLGLLGKYLHTRCGWDRGWMAICILLGIAFGIYSAVHFLRKSEHMTSMRSAQEEDGLYRIRKDNNEKKNATENKENHHES